MKKSKFTEEQIPSPCGGSRAGHRRRTPAGSWGVSRSVSMRTEASLQCRDALYLFCTWTPALLRI
jgi:hypothetical protein